MGPTTSNRMDPYVDEFQDHGGSMIMIGKGNRTQVVTDACKKHGGFYLGTIGGVAAVLSQDAIKSIECVEYPELGMEAIWKITVKDFPAFILVDKIVSPEVAIAASGLFSLLMITNLVFQLFLLTSCLFHLCAERQSAGER